MQFLPYSSINLAKDNLPNSVLPISTSFVKAARKVLCNIYKKSPISLLKGPTNIMGQIFYQNLCGEQEDPPLLPPNPVPYLEGGQCPTTYRLEGILGSTTGTKIFDGALPYPTFPGPVKRVWVTYNTSGDVGLGTMVNLGVPNPRRTIVVQYMGYNNVPVTIQIVSSGSISSLLLTAIKRTDNQPDNCGNFPDVFTGIQIINNNDLNFNYTYINPINNLNINIPVKIHLPDINNNLFMPIVNMGGIDITFDMGGINLEYNPDNRQANTEIDISLPDLLFNNRVNLNNQLNLTKNDIKADITATKTDILASSDLTLNTLTNSITDNDINFNSVQNTLSNIQISINSNSAEIIEIIETNSEEENTNLDYFIREGNCEINQENKKEFIINSNQMSGNKYLASAEIIKKELELLERKKQCLEEKETPILAIPDWWQSKRTSSPPQLVLTFKREGTRNYHTLSIPHPLMTQKPQNEPTILEEYFAGNYQGMIVLKDNSKFIVNAINQNTAEAIINEVLTLINPSMLDSPPDIAYSDRRGSKIGNEKRIPKTVKFFSQGIKVLEPNWQYKIKNTAPI